MEYEMRHISPWIFTTYKCNLKCPYCYVKQSDEFITEDTLQNIARVFYEILDKQEADAITFRIAGGEPLICFDNWQATFANMKSKYPDRVGLDILTNLAVNLIPREIQYFKDYGVFISASLDGLVKSKPYYNGMSSAEKVQGNIDLLLEHLPASRMGITTVLTSENIDELPALARWIGERRMQWVIDLAHGYNDNLSEDSIVKSMGKAIEVLVLTGYDVKEKLTFNRICFSPKYTGCKAGEDMMAIGCNGEVWACQTQRGAKPYFYLGEKPLLTGLQESFKRINTTRCGECSIVSECKGGCRIWPPKSKTCNLLKGVALNMLVGIEKEMQNAKSLRESMWV